MNAKLHTERECSHFMWIYNPISIMYAAQNLLYHTLISHAQTIHKGVFYIL